VSREELEKEIEIWKAENRAALKKARGVIEKFDREAPIRTITTALAFQRLREAARRR
jgi:hypothetical protein